MYNIDEWEKQSWIEGLLELQLGQFFGRLDISARAYV